MNQNIKYVVITPVRDEEAYIEQTITSMISQTIQPQEWIIVDDSSQDRTTEILQQYTNKYKWIRSLRLERSSQRQPGDAVILAFNEGYKLVKDQAFDFIVKLDGDLRFGFDYFERLFSRLNKDDKIGIASGIYLEQKDTRWFPIKMPLYHAAGASKIVRAECFRQIGGFIPAKGWDTVDEIKAQTMGWRTCHFEDVVSYHLKKEGSGIGKIRTNIMHGEIFFRTGGSRLFFLVKVIHRMFSGRPVIVGGLSMMWGYLRAIIVQQDLLVTEKEATLYKNLLMKRLTGQLKNCFIKHTKCRG